MKLTPIQKIEGEEFKANVTHKHDELVNLRLSQDVELTIASGIITMSRNNHTVDTEADAASDNLDTILGANKGQMIILRANNTARTVVIKNGTGNIYSGTDFSLDSDKDVWFGVYDGTNWLEITRSDNS